MVQLTNDCFAADDRLMPLDEARAIIAAKVTCVVGTEIVPLADADGRVLAAEVAAPIALPSFDNSAVDGYAIRFADLARSGDTLLPVADRVAAGQAAPALGERVAIRIFTGAHMPPGADTVFMQEDVTLREDGRVLLPPGLKLGANRRLAGEDVTCGAPALPAGRRLTPRDLALLGALGLTSVEVRRPVRAAILSTGDEIAGEGTPSGPARIHDANRPMLAALLRRAGCTVEDLGVAPDHLGAVRDLLRGAASRADLVVTSGGVSLGEEDHVRSALLDTGILAFWRLAIKPGRPVAMGTIGGAAFVGLPGNPAAAFVTFVLVARPLIAQLGGEHHVAPVALPVPAAFAARKKPGRREYVRARIATDGARVAAFRHPREGAGLITSLTETDGLVELAEDVTDIASGDLVGFLPYGSLL